MDAKYCPYEVGFTEDKKASLLDNLECAIEELDIDSLKVMYYDISRIMTIEQIFPEDDCEDCEEKEVCDSVEEPAPEPVVEEGP